MNVHGDFYVIVATTTRKREFLKAGVNPDNIKSLVRYINAGRRLFPRKYYETNLDYVEAGPDANEKVSAICLEWQAKGLACYPKYVAVD